MALSGFADTYESFSAANEALGRWRDALSSYRHSLKIWSDVGALYPGEAAKPARLRQAIERCERQAARFVNKL